MDNLIIYGAIGFLLLVMYLVLNRGVIGKRKRVRSAEDLLADYPDEYGCPSCHSTYQPHVKTCADCGDPLVESVRQSVLEDWVRALEIYREEFENLDMDAVSGKLAELIDALYKTVGEDVTFVTSNREFRAIGLASKWRVENADENELWSSDFKERRS